jgi:ATP synthase protein I
MASSEPTSEQEPTRARLKEKEGQAAGRGQTKGEPGLEDLETRLEAARQAQAVAGAGRPRLAVEQGRYGAAWRLAVELVAGLVVGTGIGWFLDWLFGTAPILLLIFFVLGAGAGIRSAYRAAAEINRPVSTPPDFDRNAEQKR